MTQGEKKKKKISQKESKDCKKNCEWDDSKFAHFSRSGLWICSGCTGTKHSNRQSSASAIGARCLGVRSSDSRSSALAPHYHRQYRHLRYRTPGSKTHRCLNNGVKGCSLKGGDWVTLSVSAGGHFPPNSQGRDCSKLRRRLFLRKYPPVSTLSPIGLGLQGVC